MKLSKYLSTRKRISDSAYYIDSVPYDVGTERGVMNIVEVNRIEVKYKHPYYAFTFSLYTSGVIYSYVSLTPFEKYLYFKYKNMSNIELSEKMDFALFILRQDRIDPLNYDSYTKFHTACKTVLENRILKSPTSEDFYIGNMDSLDVYLYAWYLDILRNNEYDVKNIKHIKTFERSE